MTTQFADADDTPQEQKLLQTAWNALAQYVTTCDDDDKLNALMALSVVADLISGAGDDENSAETWSCQFCPGRKFSTEGGLASHLGSVHADENKKTAIKPENKE